jgi:hypothetical protein
MDKMIKLDEDFNVDSFIIDNKPFRPRKKLILPESLKNELKVVIEFSEKYDTESALIEKFEQFWNETWSKNQIKLIKMLISSEKVVGKDAQHALDVSHSGIAGIMSSITRNLTRMEICDRYSPESDKLILREWNDGKWCWNYKMNPKYKEILAEIIKKNPKE